MTHKHLQLPQVVRTCAVSAILMAALSAFPAFAGVNLVVNGSFGGNSNASAVYDPGTSFISGWTVSSGSVDWIGTYWTGPNGSGGSVYVDGNLVGTIRQMLHTNSGTNYLVRFDTNSIRPGTTPDPVFVSAWAQQSLFQTVTGPISITFTDTDTPASNLAATPEPALFGAAGVGFASLVVAVRKRRRV